MNRLTDDFDMALQVTEEALGRVVQTQHPAGVIAHKYARNYGGKRIDLVINSPQVSLLSNFGSNQPAKALVTSRVFYHSRSLHDAADVGRGAVADVTVHSTFTLSSGDPGRLTPDTRLIVDWSETSRDDIVVHGVPNDLENEVKDALIEFVNVDGGGSFPIPPIGSSDHRIGSLAFRFNIQLTSSVERLLVVGMNVGDTVKGSKAGMTEKFVERDWALTISDTYFLSEVRKKLQALFPLPYRLARMCTVNAPWPFEGCWNWMRVFLTALDVHLESGRIKVTGSLRIRNSGALIPDTSATFTAFGNLSIGPQQTLTFSVYNTSVSFGDWVGEVFNFITGDYFENKIRDGIESAFQAGTGESITNFFTSEAFTGLASIGSRRSLDIEPRATHVTIRPEGVIIHGDLITPHTDDPPEAAFFVINPREMPAYIILHAGESWSPGGTITEYKWEFSDGTSQTSSGTNARFVKFHNLLMSITETIGAYGGARSVVCLTVTDDSGRKTSTCGPWLPPPTLIIEIIPVPGLFVVPVELPSVGSSSVQSSTSIFHTDGQTRDIDRDLILARIPDKISLRLCVRCGRMPVKEALVKASGTNWSVEGYTDDEGGVTLEIDLGKLQISSKIHNEFVKLYARGQVLIEASKDGFKSARQHLWIVSGDDRKSLVRRMKKRIEALEHKLQKITSGYSPRVDLKSLLEIADLKLRMEIAHIVLLLDLIRKVTNFIDHGSGLAQIISNLNIQEKEEKVVEVIAKRIDKLSSTIEEGLKRLAEWEGKKRSASTKKRGITKPQN